MGMLTTVDGCQLFVIEFNVSKACLNGVGRGCTGFNWLYLGVTNYNLFVAVSAKRTVL